MRLRAFPTSMFRVSSFWIVSLGGAVVGSACGGGIQAQVRATVHPADRATVTPRRLDSLAATFEGEAGCGATDTIQIRGIAPSVYNVDGCGRNRDYIFVCRAGAYGARCAWNEIDDLALATAETFHCEATAMDVQMTSPSTPMLRSVTGCGYVATYELQCRGGCIWVTATLPSAVSAAPTPIDTSNGGTSSYIVQ